MYPRIMNIPLSPFSNIVIFYPICNINIQRTKIIHYESLDTLVVLPLSVEAPWVLNTTYHQPHI